MSHVPVTNEDRAHNDPATRKDAEQKQADIRQQNRSDIVRGDPELARQASKKRTMIGDPLNFDKIAGDLSTNSDARACTKLLIEDLADRIDSVQDGPQARADLATALRANANRISDAYAANTPSA